MASPGAFAYDWSAFQLYKRVYYWAKDADVHFLWSRVGLGWPAGGDIGDLQ